MRKAGFSKPQAEAVVATVQEASEAADLATKFDLSRVRGELKAELAELRAELKAEIAAIRDELREVRLRLQGRIEALRPIF